MFSLQVDSFYWTAEDRSIAVDVISSGTNDQYSNMLYVYDTGAEVHLFYARHLTNELNCFVPVQHFTHVLSVCNFVTEHFISVFSNIR